LSLSIARVASHCNVLLTPALIVTSSQSSTFVDVEPNGFNISYVDGSGSTGDYFQDTFSMSGATLNNFEMGLATQTSIPYGLIGIAYADAEANVFTGNGSQYPNLVDALVNSGIIPTQAYSLWLDDLGKFFQITNYNIGSDKIFRSEYWPDPLRRYRYSEI
jgi:hypothetical protein